MRKRTGDDLGKHGLVENRKWLRARACVASSLRTSAHLSSKGPAIESLHRVRRLRYCLRSSVSQATPNSLCTVKDTLRPAIAAARRAPVLPLSAQDRFFFFFTNQSRRELRKACASAQHTRRITYIATIHEIDDVATPSPQRRHASTAVFCKASMTACVTCNTVSGYLPRTSDSVGTSFG